jgi:hypothetical protein
LSPIFSFRFGFSVLLAFYQTGLIHAVELLRGKPLPKEPLMAPTPCPTGVSVSKLRNNDYTKSKILLSLQQNTTPNTNKTDNEEEIKQR